MPRAPNAEPPSAARRGFLQAAGASAAALVLGVHVPLAPRARAAAGSMGPLIFDPNVFLRIAADDTVTVVSKHFEMGQGITTGLATLAAEELEADWAQMRFTFSPYNPALYNNLAFGPYMVTGGSNSLAGSWVQMRKVGAAARTMLMRAAAVALGRAGGGGHRHEGHRLASDLAAFGPVRRARRGRNAARSAQGRRAEGAQGLEADRQEAAATRCRRQDDGQGDVLNGRAAARRADRHGAPPRRVRRQGRLLRRQLRDDGAGRGRRREDTLRRRRARDRHLVGHRRTGRGDGNLGQERGGAALHARDRRGLSQARRRAGAGGSAPGRCGSRAGARHRRWWRPSSSSPTWRTRRWSPWPARSRSAPPAPRSGQAVRSRASTHTLPPRSWASRRSRSRSTTSSAAAASAGAAIPMATGLPSWRRSPRPSAARRPYASCGHARTTSRAATTGH